MTKNQQSDERKRRWIGDFLSHDGVVPRPDGLPEDEPTPVVDAVAVPIEIADPRHSE